jgi:hypothetical protein
VRILSIEAILKRPMRYLVMHKVLAMLQEKREHAECAIAIIGMTQILDVIPKVCQSSPHR